MTETRDEVLAGAPPRQRAELEALDRAIREAAPSLAATAGGGGLGYGHYWYRYATGREGDWFALSLVPRAGNVALYLGPGGVERWADRLPTVACGKGCIRLKRASDMPPDVLREIAEAATTIDGKLLDWTGRNQREDPPLIRDR
jgi:uncharacterized protein YdhG (YjbR/CyaY superfamily)